MNDQKTFLILDGNALLHRAWHAIPPLTTKDGRVVNAAYGFVMVVEKMLSQFAPDYMAVAWDLPGATFRHVEYVEYKATREKKAPELYEQIPLIQEVLSAYHIPSLSAPGFEADDIIGTIASHNKRQGFKTLIVTGDLDSLQLVDDTTNVVFFVKGLSQTTLYDAQAVQARYGLRPDQMIDYKTFIGDTSDNLPGLQGIGEKTALELLQKFDTVKGVFEGLKRGEVPSKFAKKLEGKEDVAKQMCRLVTIVRDVDLSGFDVSTAHVKSPDVAKLIPLLRDLEFKTLLKKYESGATIVETPKKTKVVAKNGKLESISGSRLGVVLIEKPTDLFGGGIRSIGLTDGEHFAVFEEPTKELLQQLVARLAQADVVVAHDIKHLLHVLWANEVAVTELAKKKFFDTMVAAYLLASGDRDVTFVDLVREILNEEAKTDVLGTLSVLLLLADKQQERLVRDGMAKLSDEIEMPLIPVLFAMERDGIAVDSDKLIALSADFEKTLASLTTKIYSLAGREFNINSPSQLAEILFTDLAIPTKGIKKTKSGFSTAAPELEKIADAHAIIPFISEYREVAKLKSTYSDTLPQLVGKDGRIHAQFNQCVAATGRLSSSNPNLQNIPIRSELGREIRKAFVAAPGCKLVSADYSQIELRLAAEIAKDKAFIEAFRDGADIHRRTAAEMWNISEDEVTKEQRYAAKAINFGILYGIGPRSLARSAGVSFEEAREFIDRYFVVHPGIHIFIDEMKVRAHANEYVETRYGRRRYLPDINSGVPQLVAAAERMAINMPAQGTQADIIKLAMRRVADWIEAENIPAKLLLQVHDELVLEVADAAVDQVSERVREIMTSAVILDVPLAVDVEAATNWGEMS